MSTGYHVVVCGSVVPDPLQTLEPVVTPGGPALKNEAMLPVWLDPWAGHALYEAAHLVAQHPSSRLWLVSLGPKARLQQVLMSVAQKVPFEFVALDGSAGGFTEPAETAAALAEAIRNLAGLETARLLVAGGWESASRGAGVTLQAVAERLGITEVFLGVDSVSVLPDGTLEVLERIEGGRHQVSRFAGPPAVLGWATGHRPEPRNHPQVGMQNMRQAMPALQKAKPTKVGADGVRHLSVTLPRQLRQTRVVRDLPPEAIAREIVDWIRD